MDTLSINNFIKSYQKCNIFKGVFACDTLPRRITYPAAFVVNLSKHNESGSHWIAIYISEDKRAYYFDSFGFGINNTFIDSFLNQHSIHIAHNRKQLQHITSNKCGRFCCVFIVSLLNDVSIRTFLNRFSINLFINDIVIENMYTFLKKRAQ